MYIAFVAVVIFFTIATKGSSYSRGHGNLINAPATSPCLLSHDAGIVIRHIDLSVGY